MTLWNQVRELEHKHQAAVRKIVTLRIAIANARHILENEPDPGEAATLAARALELENH